MRPGPAEGDAVAMARRQREDAVMAELEAGWWRSGNGATASSRATGLDASRRAKPARSGSSRATSRWWGLTGPGEGRRSAMAEEAEEGAKQRRRLGRWREQQGSAMEGHC